MDKDIILHRQARFSDRLQHEIGLSSEISLLIMLIAAPLEWIAKGINYGFIAFIAWNIFKWLGGEI